MPARRGLAVQQSQHHGNADRNIGMITQSQKEKLNIVRILIQCSLDESRFHTCNVPSGGDMTGVVLDEIDIDDDGS